MIPDNLKKGVQIAAFGDLNSIIASGDQRQVARVEQFLRSIDKTVPLITIEVMIGRRVERRAAGGGTRTRGGHETHTDERYALPGPRHDARGEGRQQSGK